MCARFPLKLVNLHEKYDFNMSEVRKMMNEGLPDEKKYGILNISNKAQERAALFVRKRRLQMMLSPK